MANVTKEQIAAFYERAADTYEELGPLMRHHADALLAAMPPMTSASVLHDNACGPGIVTEQMLKRGPAPAKVYATDISPPMIRAVEKRQFDVEMEAEVMNATELTFPDATFSHSATNIAVMSLSFDEAKAALRHVYRTLKPSGSAGVTTWAVIGYMRVFEELVEQVKPGAHVPEDLPLRQEWLRAETLRDLLKEAGFHADNIVISQYKGYVSGDTFSFPGLAEIWNWIITPTTAGWSDEERAAFDAAFKARLAEEQKNPRQYEMTAWVGVAKK